LLVLEIVAVVTIGVRDIDTAFGEAEKHVARKILTKDFSLQHHCSFAQVVVNVAKPEFDLMSWIV